MKKRMAKQIIKDVLFGIILLIFISAFGIGVTYLIGDHLKYHKVFCMYNKCTYQVVDLLKHDQLFYEAQFNKKDLRKTWFVKNKTRQGYTLQASTNDLITCKRKNAKDDSFFDCISKFYKADISPVFFTQKSAGRFYVKMIRRMYFKYKKIDLLLIEGEVLLAFVIIIGLVIKNIRQKNAPVQTENKEELSDEILKDKIKKGIDLKADDGPIKKKPIPPEKKDSDDSISEKLKNYRQEK